MAVDRADFEVTVLGNTVVKELTEVAYISILQQLLFEGPMMVSFMNAKDELREMRCTLSPEFLPALPPVDPDAPPKKERKKNPDVIAVWDLDKEAWRSFRKASVMTYMRDSEEEDGI